MTLLSWSTLSYTRSSREVDMVIDNYTQILVAYINGIYDYNKRYSVQD